VTRQLVVRRSVILLNYVPDEQELYGEALRRAGFDVTTCGNPLDALDELFKSPPAAFVTRILQPGYTLDGIEITRRIKQSERTRHVAVVITSTQIQAHYRDAAMQAGCDAYILLPALPDEVVGAVRRLIQPSTSAAASRSHDIERRRIPRRSVVPEPTNDETSEPTDDETSV